MLRASWLCFTRAVSNSGFRRSQNLALIAAFSLAMAANPLMASSGTDTEPDGACKSCVTVTVSPLAPTIAEGEKLQFTATVTNRRNTAVIWSASSGSITTEGVFTAPKNFTSRAITVTAKVWRRARLRPAQP